MKAFWIGACCVMSALACGSDDDDAGGTADEQSPAGECADAPSFDEVTAFSEVCTNCHDSSLALADRNFAPLGWDFDKYEVASMKAEDIQNAVEEGYMPPPGYTLTEAQKAQLLQWVACGTPE